MVDHPRRSVVLTLVEHPELPARHCGFGSVVLIQREHRILNGFELDDFDVSTLPSPPGIVHKLLEPAEIVQSRCAKQPSMIERQASDHRVPRAYSKIVLTHFVQYGGFGGCRLKRVRVLGRAKHYPRPHGIVKPSCTLARFGVEDFVGFVGRPPFAEMKSMMKYL